MKIYNKFELDEKDIKDAIKFYLNRPKIKSENIQIKVVRTLDQYSCEQYGITAIATEHPE